MTQVTGSGGSYRLPQQRDTVVDVKQLQAMLKPWVEDGSIEGQRMGYFVKACGDSMNHPEIKAPELELFLSMKAGPLELGDMPYEINTDACQGFLDMLCHRQAKAMTTTVIRFVPKDDDHWGDDWITKGRRGLFIQSLKRLTDFAYGDTPDAGLIGECQPNKADWETDACRLFNRIHDANERRSGGGLSTEEMMIYRMFRITGIMCGRPFSETRQDPPNCLEWIQIAEPRIGLGLTEQDWETGYIKSFKTVAQASAEVQGKLIDPISIVAREVERELKIALLYHPATQAVDAYLKDPKRFDEYLRQATKT